MRWIFGVLLILAVCLVPVDSWTKTASTGKVTGENQSAPPTVPNPQEASIEESKRMIEQFPKYLVEDEKKMAQVTQDYMSTIFALDCDVGIKRGHIEFDASDQAYFTQHILHMQCNMYNPEDLQLIPLPLAHWVVMTKWNAVIERKTGAKKWMIIVRQLIPIDEQGNPLGSPNSAPSKPPQDNGPTL